MASAAPGADPPEHTSKEPGHADSPKDSCGLMRRGLSLIPAVLVVVGVELSTEAVSVALGRLRSGVMAVLSGVEFYLPKMRFGAGLFALVLGLVLWVLLLWAARQRRVLASMGRACPTCGGDTRRVGRTEPQRWLGALMGEQVTRQTCVNCGWTGLSLFQ